MNAISYHQIHHVTMLCKDLNESLDFYCGVLNFEKKHNRPDLGFDGAWLAVNSQQEIHLMALENPDPVDGRPAHGGRDRHAAFAVHYLPPLQQQLENHNIPYTKSKSGRAALFVRDPDGNALEFIEEKA